MKKIKVCLIIAEASASPGNLPHLDSTLRFLRRNFANFRGKFRNFRFSGIWRKHYKNTELYVWAGGRESPFIHVVFHKSFANYFNK